MTDPIRIFIGCSGNDEDLEFQCVLHYTLDKYASEPLDITWMRLSRNPSSFWYADPQQGRGWNTKTWATPFSALRWGIPECCGFEGRAIYMDLDMIALDDIAKLWNQNILDGRSMLAKESAICVSVYDNARMKNILPPVSEWKHIAGAYRNIRNKVMKTPGVIQRYEGNWNCLDGEKYARLDDPDIKVLHFTDIPTQPHLRHAIPRLKREGKEHWYKGAPIRDHPRKEAIALFDRLLNEAQAAGYHLDRYRNPTPFGDYGRGK